MQGVAKYTWFKYILTPEQKDSLNTFFFIMIKKEYTTDDYAEDNSG